MDEELVLNTIVEIQVVILTRVDTLALANERRNAAKLLTANPELHVYIPLVQLRVRFFLRLAGQVKQINKHLIAVNFMFSILKPRKIRSFRIFNRLLNRNGIALQIIVSMNA